MILHICNSDKFIPPFIDFVDRTFGLSGHQFWSYGNMAAFTEGEACQTVRLEGGRLRKLALYACLIREMHKADKIILHSLFGMKIVYLLYFMPWLLKKCYWVMWGGDLYVYKLGKRDWKWRVKEFFRKKVIREMGYLLTYLKGDIDLVRKWYGAKGAHINCLMYSSNTVDESMMPEIADLRAGKTISILLGNSADPSNNHIEAMGTIAKFKNENIKVYSVLSYGDKVNAQRVVKKGQELLGERFVPVTEFMAYPEYVDFLKGMDIAVFNHRRQQAMGNTINLLGMGKTVYMRSDVSQWALFKEEGVKVFDVERFDLCLMDLAEARENARKVKARFSKERLKSQYERIFLS